jgi:FlaA1/EpsC-like NDP-sugar epimerase
MLRADSGDWTDFLGRRLWQGTFNELGAANAGKIVLVTGAGGYIGSGLIEALGQAGVRQLILLECSEQNLESIDRNLSARSSPPCHIAVLGDAGNPQLLEEVFRTYRPEIIYHAAAFKHLPFMESHPFAAVRNNALTTYVLAQTAVQHGVEKLILISTDKAVNPTSMMGATKRVSELVILTLSGARTLMTAIRLSNVLGSPGSVAPLFTEQIARGEPVTVTSPDATRYFMTREDSVKCIVRAAAHKAGRHVLIPDMGAPLKILDLAHFLMRRQGREVPVVFSGLRPGEKLNEQLFSSPEAVHPCADCSLNAEWVPRLMTDKVCALLTKIEESVSRRDAAGMLRELLALVPEYQPSELLLDLAARKREASAAT